MTITKQRFHVLSGIAAVCSIVSWLAASYFDFLPDASNTPRPDLGRTHCLNNHGTLVCLTDREWHARMALMVGAATLFLLSGILDYASGNKTILLTKAANKHWWVHDPNLDKERGWTTRRF